MLWNSQQSADFHRAKHKPVTSKWFYMTSKMEWHLFIKFFFIVWFFSAHLPFHRRGSPLSHHFGLKSEMHLTYTVATVERFQRERKKRVKTTMLAKVIV